MQLDPKEIKRGLLRKKWKEIEKKHHTYFYFQLEGKVTHIRTYISRGSKAYGKPLLNEIKRQLHLDNIQQVVDYIKCDLSNKEYISILKSKGKL